VSVTLFAGYAAMSKTYCVYTLANRTGVTGSPITYPAASLWRGRFFIAVQYFPVGHFEMFADVRAAIDRETEIKAWRREKKIRLIESMNPTWQDLAAQLPHIYGNQQSKK
jgi:hypothetical protein